MTHAPSPEKKLSGAEAARANPALLAEQVSRELGVIPPREATSRVEAKYAAPAQHRDDENKDGRLDTHEEVLSEHEGEEPKRRAGSRSADSVIIGLSTVGIGWYSAALVGMNIPFIASMLVAQGFSAAFAAAVLTPAIILGVVTASVYGLAMVMDAGARFLGAKAGSENLLKRYGGSLWWGVKKIGRVATGRLGK